MESQSNKRQNQQMTGNVEENKSDGGSYPPGFSLNKRKMGLANKTGPIGQINNNHLEDSNEERNQKWITENKKENDAIGENNLVGELDREERVAEYRAKPVPAQ
ncbi:hypothetical protein SLA2020_073320 [Shorea laevis]